MAGKRKSIKLKGIEGLSIDSMIDKYIERLNKLVVVDDTRTSANGTWEPEIKVLEPKHKPARNILYPKFQLLIHLIISGCISNDNNITHLHVKKYTKVFGRSFSDMLYALESLYIISIGFYEVGISSRPISLNRWDITEYETLNTWILKSFKTISKKDFSLSEENEKKEIPVNEFTENYNSSLSLLRLQNKKDALDYIDKNIEKKTHQYQYYLYSINKFNNPKITSIDSNGRIYHYLTNLPKELKQFINIKYQLDIHNSHPLLFNYYLMKDYKLSYDFINKFLYIYNFNNPPLPPYNRYGMQSFQKFLNDNKIQPSIDNKAPDDVLLYIMLTSRGEFWDYFSSDSVERQVIKSNLFSKVFYPKEDYLHDSLVKIFIELFPSVWDLVQRMRADKAEISLPNRMMSFESVLMKKILIKLYSRNYKVVSIHDAVIVLDVEENKTFRCDEAVRIMEEVYAEYGLFPSVDVMTFEKGA